MSSLINLNILYAMVVKYNKVISFMLSLLFIGACNLGDSDKKIESTKRERNLQKERDLLKEKSLQKERDLLNLQKEKECLLFCKKEQKKLTKEMETPLDNLVIAIKNIDPNSVTIPEELDEIQDLILSAKISKNPKYLFNTYRTIKNFIEKEKNIIKRSMDESKIDKLLRYFDLMFAVLKQVNK